MKLLISLALLPDEPMVGRAADRRVGFFTTAYTDVGTHSAEARPDLPSQYERVNPEASYNTVCSAGH